MTNWRAEAKCVDEDPELFFPIGSSAQALEQTEEAKQVCRGCPVREQCLDQALELGVWGVWGATTQDDRDRMQSRIKVAA